MKPILNYHLLLQFFFISTPSFINAGSCTPDEPVKYVGPFIGTDFFRMPEKLSRPFYGWDNAFDKNGKWIKGPLHGYVILVENINEKYHAKYIDTPFKGDYPSCCYSVAG